MKWTDINDIAIELDEAHPDIDPMSIRVTEVMGWVLALDGFDDDRRIEPRCKPLKPGDRRSPVG